MLVRTATSKKVQRGYSQLGTVHTQDSQ